MKLEMIWETPGYIRKVRTAANSDSGKHDE